MKVLVTIPHFYNLEGDGRYGSTRKQLAIAFEGANAQFTLSGHPLRYLARLLLLPASSPSLAGQSELLFPIGYSYLYDAKPSSSGKTTNTAVAIQAPSVPSRNGWWISMPLLV